ncbi:MAG: type VI secretion system-associated FHA domain protein TagH [Alphaproteobacteria bacterium]|nr:type VI secretion system-associated FHA domain protein TagH [Alphaproteobacteria bacterium]
MHLKLVCGSETRTLDEGQMVLGASGDCDWILHDDYISGRHCRIERAGDGYVLTDISRNGVFLNGADSRIRGGTVPLANGDSFRLGTLVVQVTFQDAAPEPIAATSPPPADIPRPSHSELPPILAGRAEAPPPPATDAGRSFSPSGTGNPAAADTARRTSTQDPGAQLRRTNIRLSSVLGNDSALDAPVPLTFNESRKHSRDVSTSLKKLADLLDDYGIDLPGTAAQPAPESAPEPATSPPPRPASAAPPAPRQDNGFQPTAPSEGDLLRAYLEGAGLPPDAATVSDPAALLRQQGELMRQLLQGLLSLLALRNQVKREFRVPATQLGPTENNPLKFAGSAGRALESMVAPAQPGFLTPTRAVADIFEDLIRHEAAMTGAARDALFAVVETLAPEAINDSMKGRGWSLSKDAALWKRYKEAFAAATERGEESTLIKQFRQAFAHAYIKHFRD